MVFYNPNDGFWYADTPSDMPDTAFPATVRVISTEDSFTLDDLGNWIFNGRWDGETISSGLKNIRDSIIQNSGGRNIGGTVKWFASVTDRDDYYTQNPDQLKDGISVGVGNPVNAYTFDGSQWLGGALAFRGTDGTNGTNGTDGVDGRDIELSVSGLYIVWRYVGAASWNTLVALSVLTGADGQNGLDGTNGTDGTNGRDGTDGLDGINGETPQFQMSGNTLQYRFATQQPTSWTNLYTFQGGGGGGTSDHSALSNLNYANSGHTGFATSAQGAKADSALQSESDPIYTADKANIALKSDIPDITGLATESYVDSAVATEASARDSAIADKTVTALDYDASIHAVKATKGDSSTLAAVLPIANEVTDGLIPMSAYEQIQQNKDAIQQLAAGTRVIRIHFSTVFNSANPTDAEIKAFLDTVSPAVIYDTVRLTNIDTKEVWTLNTQTGKFENNGLDTLNVATLTTLGGVMSSETVGQCFVEMDGTISVIGWDALNTLVNGKAPANAALTAETGAGTDINTNAVGSSTIANILQTIWAKIRQVVNVLNGKQNNIPASTSGYLATHSGTAGTFGTPVNSAAWQKSQVPASTNGYLLTASGTAGAFGTPVNPANLTGNNTLPQVLRISVAGRQSGANAIDQRVIIDLDRPAPSGCVLQIWRFSKKTGTNGGGRKIVRRKAYRPIQLDSTGWPSSTYNVAIPTGATQFTIPTPRQLYKPRQFRRGIHSGYIYKPENLYIGGAAYISGSGVDWRKPNKVLYKFGVRQGGAMGLMSGNTLEIMYHFGWGAPNVPAHGIQSTLIARVY